MAKEIYKEIYKPIYKEVYKPIYGEDGTTTPPSNPSGGGSTGSGGSNPAPSKQDIKIGASDMTIAVNASGTVTPTLNIGATEVSITVPPATVAAGGDIVVTLTPKNPALHTVNGQDIATMTFVAPNPLVDGGTATLKPAARKRTAAGK